METQSIRIAFAHTHCSGCALRGAARALNVGHRIVSEAKSRENAAYHERFCLLYYARAFAARCVSVGRRRHCSPLFARTSIFLHFFPRLRGRRGIFLLSARLFAALAALQNDAQEIERKLARG